MQCHESLLRLLGSVFGLLVLAGCGGGGGGGGGGGLPPPAPTVSLTPQAIKTFRFTWTDVAGETEYRLLEDPNGASGFTRVATIAADATSYDHTVFLPARIQARYILQACNGAGCADSAVVAVSGTLAAAAGYLKASNAQSGDYFGIALALSGDGHTLAVGATGEDSAATGVGGNQSDETAALSGAVYVFTRTGAAWSQQAYIKASNAQAGDYFGTALALSADGNTLAVGAVGEASSAGGINGNENDNSASLSGAVYVFTRAGNAWSKQAYVKASNTGAADYFGQAVALSADGNTLAVSAPGEDSAATGINGNQSDNGAANSGAVYVFTRAGTAWSQQAYVKASNTGGGDWFGQSLALSADGNTLAVGAIGEASAATGIGGDQTSDVAPGSGAVYVFTRSAGTWSQQAYVKASNAAANDGFGSSVALAADGNTLAVGARYEASAATGINGNQADNAAMQSGAVYVFTRAGSSWSQQAYVKASNAGANDWFGHSVALSADGNVLAVGAVREASAAAGVNGSQVDDTAAYAGAVYVFIRSGSAWAQQAYVKAPNAQGGDYFGVAIALSADGRTVAAGAYGEASNATGIGGNQSDNTASASGAVYLY